MMKSQSQPPSPVHTGEMQCLDTAVPKSASEAGLAGKRPIYLDEEHLAYPLPCRMWEETLITEATVSFRSLCWVCQPVSTCSSWAISHQTLKCFCLVLFILCIGFIVVEVNCGLHSKSG